jgi:hypothetical protein
MVRGDAYRLAGHEAEARNAYADAARGGPPERRKRARIKPSKPAAADDADMLEMDPLEALDEGADGDPRGADSDPIAAESEVAADSDATAADSDAAAADATSAAMDVAAGEATSEPRSDPAPSLADDERLPTSDPNGDPIA